MVSSLKKSENKDIDTRHRKPNEELGKSSVPLRHNGKASWFKQTIATRFHGHWLPACSSVLHQ